MRKMTSKLGLVAALVLVGGILGGSLSPSQAQEPCRVRHFGCPQGMIDCCCGVKFRCFGSSAQCAAFCSPFLTRSAGEGAPKQASCSTPKQSSEREDWQSFLAEAAEPEPAAAE